MKKQMTLFLSLALLLCLCGCSNSTENNNASNKSESSNSSVTVDNEKTVIDSLPANYNEAYTCVIDGYEGSVYFSNYEIIPDELNEGMVDKTVTLTAVFHGVSEDFSIHTVVFPLIDSLSAIDDTAWMISGENEGLIFEYENNVYGMMEDEDTYRAEITVCYSVPEGFDELAFALTDQPASYPMEQLSKEDFVDEDTCWFIMGSLQQQQLTYNGELLATLAGNADVNTMFNYGSGPSDEWTEQEKQEDLSHIQESIGVQLVFMNEHMVESYNGRTIQFDKIELVSGSEEEYIVRVVISQDGLKEGDVIFSLLFDCYSEVHVDEKLWKVDGNSVAFEFSLNPKYAPYTITAGANDENGNYLFKEGTHVDVDFK